MNHTQLLNYLVDKYNLQSYLEIGVRTTEQNFDKIKCPIKIGVDPEIKDNSYLGAHLHRQTSDRYFEIKFGSPELFIVFDLIFIDGLHHADQVQRDFENSLKCLNDGGFIVIHDCLPEKEETTHVPRDSKIWHGNVYKFVMKLSTFPGVRFITLNMDNGCCVVWKDEDKKALDVLSQKLNPTWDAYQNYGKALMHIIDPAYMDLYLPRLKESI